jgi:hypothetical protein
MLINLSLVMNSTLLVLAGLQNDFKNMTKDIDQKLQTFHQKQRDEGNASVSMDIDQMEVPEQLTPIAKVNLVSEGSPAFHAVRIS